MQKQYNKIDFFNSYWAALAKQGWKAVVLHSWEDYPERFDSDVDYAVLGPSRAELLRFLDAFARDRGWRLIQAIDHEPGAVFCVCIQTGTPFDSIQLDVCWAYRRKGHVYLTADFLFQKIMVANGKAFFVPTPGVQICYLLAKAVAKGKSFEIIRPQLEGHLAAASADVQSLVSQAFGSAPQDLMDFESWKTWFDEYTRCQIVTRRRRIGIKEVVLYCRRVVFPTGFVYQTTLAATDPLVVRLIAVLSPAFRQVVVDVEKRRFSFRLSQHVHLLRTRLVVVCGHPAGIELDGDCVITECIERLAKRITSRLRKREWR